MLLGIRLNSATRPKTIHPHFQGQIPHLYHLGALKILSDLSWMENANSRKATPTLAELVFFLQY